MNAAARSRAGRLTRAPWSSTRLAAGCIAVALAVAGCAGTAADGTASDGTAGDGTAVDMTSANEPTPTADALSSVGAADAITGPAPAASPRSPAPLLTSAPDEHSQVGDLVKGFPADLLPVPRDSVILVTSAIPVGDADVQEVSLNLRTSMTAQDLLVMYRTALLDAGFDEAAPPTNPQTDLAVESVFTRSGGDELVSIGVLDADGVRTVTIGGRVHTAP